eukprot:97940_1
MSLLGFIVAKECNRLIMSLLIYFIAAIVIVCFTYYKYRNYLKQNRIICKYCNCNILLCALINQEHIPKKSYYTNNYYTPLIPKWLIYELTSKTEHSSHFQQIGLSKHIGNFIIYPSPYMGWIRNKNELTSYNEIYFVAWWKPYKLQNSKINIDFESESIVCNHIFKQGKSSRSDIKSAKYLTTTMKQLGWSDIHKSSNYLTSIIDLTITHVNDLKRVLNEGKQFIADVVGIDSQNIYCYVQFPTADIYGTLHFHFKSKLDWFDLYGIYVLKRSIFVEELIECLETDNIDSLYNKIKQCAHRAKK